MKLDEDWGVHIMPRIDEAVLYHYCKREENKRVPVYTDGEAFCEVCEMLVPQNIIDVCLLGDYQIGVWANAVPKYFTYIRVRTLDWK